MKIIYDRVTAYVKNIKNDEGYYFCYLSPSEKPCPLKHDITRTLVIVDKAYFKKPEIEKYK